MENDMSNPERTMKQEIKMSIKYKLVSLVSMLIVTTVIVIIILATYLFREDNETRVKENNHMLSKTIALKTRSDFETIFLKFQSIDLIERTNQSRANKNKIIQNIYFSKNSNFIYTGIAKKIGENYIFKNSY